jgi:hypothetical protein
MSTCQSYVASKGTPGEEGTARACGFGVDAHEASNRAAQTAPTRALAVAIAGAAAFALALTLAFTVTFAIALAVAAVDLPVANALSVTVVVVKLATIRVFRG